MRDVIRVQDSFYVLASSSLADDRTRVLKFADTFAVFNRNGDIETVGQGQLGLFHVETRHLSRMTIRLNGQNPLLLSSTIRDDNSFLSVDLTNLDQSPDSHAAIPRGTIHMYRSKFIDDNCCYEQLRLTNYGLEPLTFSLSFEFEGDFADIFEVRGTPRSRKGTLQPAQLATDSVTLSYFGLDRVLRSTSLFFSPFPDSLTEKSAEFVVKLAPKADSSIFVTVVCGRDTSPGSPRQFREAFASHNQRCDAPIFDGCKLETSSKRFNMWLTRSGSDLRMLMRGNKEGPYPYAGVPWFNTVFGRDGIITALECLWIAPSIAEGVLNYLASTQASELSPEQDAEPGKIVHEVRRGEMAVLKEVPFAQYYGSVDATPLFVLLAGAFLLRTNNLAMIQKLWPNILRALEWIDRYGDKDGDCFVEYSRKSSNGLSQQGWKDSSDSIFHANGVLAEPPIALCEVQAYVYGAKMAASLMARALGLQDFAILLERQAAALQSRFEEHFWSDELGSYVLALDGQKRPCQVRSSNAGHALFCKIASKDHASILAETFMKEDMFSGWGVRTIAAGEVRYNPMSYHNGSVWPHDNALVAMGLSHYGFQSNASDILYGLYEASLNVDLHRLPELFCGFHKRADAGAPTLYPVACAPQAWAAGSVYLLLAAALGISISAPEKVIRFSNPTLPPNLEVITIENLRVAEATVDLLVRRHSDGVAVEVLRRTGDLEVVKSV